jgi:hypothetical protein
VISPSRQQIIKNTVRINRTGKSTLITLFAHLNGETSAAMPNPNVKLKKLLPKIFPTEKSGCPSNVAVITDIMSGSAVPRDTSNIPVATELTLNLRARQMAESHSSFAPYVKNTKPKTNTSIVENATTPAKV